MFALATPLLSLSMASPLHSDDDQERNILEYTSAERDEIVVGSIAIKILLFCLFVGVVGIHKFERQILEQKT